MGNRLLWLTPIINLMTGFGQTYCQREVTYLATRTHIQHSPLQSQYTDIMWILSGGCWGWSVYLASSTLLAFLDMIFVLFMPGEVNTQTCHIFWCHLYWLQCPEGQGCPARPYQWNVYLSGRLARKVGQYRVWIIDGVYSLGFLRTCRVNSRESRHAPIYSVADRRLHVCNIGFAL